MFTQILLFNVILWVVRSFYENSNSIEWVEKLKTFLKTWLIFQLRFAVIFFNTFGDVPFISCGMFEKTSLLDDLDSFI